MLNVFRVFFLSAAGGGTYNWHLTYQRQVPEDSSMLSVELCYPDTSRAYVISKHGITYGSCFLVVPTRMQEVAQYRTCYSPASVEGPVATSVVFSPCISCKTAECVLFLM